MRVLIIGAGRMGLRHAEGVALLEKVSEICLTDISEEALSNAIKIVSSCPNPGRFRFITSTELEKTSENYDVSIIASTAANRLDTVRLVTKKNVRCILLEKPLGQSYGQVLEIVDFFERFHPQVQVYVNLSMRLNPSVAELKKDLQILPQMKGPKTITINTGAIGIGANGIHYLDLLYYLFDAEEATISAAEIEDTTIPSGRGVQFADFGGWAVIKFSKNDQHLAKAILSIASDSSALGLIDIIGTNGRIVFDEIRLTRSDMLRKSDSTMPVYKYQADYMPDKIKKIISLSIPELTYLWLENLIMGIEMLPNLKETLKAHRLMFDWLSYSNTHKEFFPIT